MSELEPKSIEATINAALQKAGASLEPNGPRQPRVQTPEKQPPEPSVAQKASEFLLALSSLDLDSPFPMSA